MIKEALETLPAETHPTYEEEIRNLLDDIGKEELENLKAIADDQSVIERVRFNAYFTMQTWIWRRYDYDIVSKLVQQAIPSVIDIVRIIAEELSKRWFEQFSDSALISPAGSAAFVFLDSENDRIDVGVVGDCTILWWQEDIEDLCILTGVKYSASEKSFLNEVKQFNIHGEKFEAHLIANRQRYIAGPPSLILSTNPDVANEVDTCAIEEPAGISLLVMSDGFARVLELTTIEQSWSRAIELMYEYSLAWLLGELRRCEIEGSSFVSGHYKTSDDATAMLLRVAKRMG